MAHLKLFRDDDGTPRVFLNDLDLTHELYADGLRIATTGSSDFDEVCIDLRLCLSRLDVGEHEDLDAALLVGGSLAQKGISGEALESMIRAAGQR